jgi:hypothetical protein
MSIVFAAVVALCSELILREGFADKRDFDVNADCIRWFVILGGFLCDLVSLEPAEDV